MDSEEKVLKDFIETDTEFQDLVRRANGISRFTLWGANVDQIMHIKKSVDEYRMIPMPIFCQYYKGILATAILFGSAFASLESLDGSKSFDICTGKYSVVFNQWLGTYNIDNKGTLRTSIPITIKNKTTSKSTEGEVEVRLTKLVYENIPPDKCQVHILESVIRTTVFLEGKEIRNYPNFLGSFSSADFLLVRIEDAVLRWAKDKESSLSESTLSGITPAVDEATVLDRLIADDSEFKSLVKRANDLCRSFISSPWPATGKDLAAFHFSRWYFRANFDVPAAFFEAYKVMLAWIIYVYNVVNENLAVSSETYDIPESDWLVEFTGPVSGTVLANDSSYLYLKIMLPVNLRNLHSGAEPHTQLIIYLYNSNVQYMPETESYRGQLLSSAMGINLFGNYRGFAVKDFSLPNLLYQMHYLLPH